MCFGVHVSFDSILSGGTVFAFVLFFCVFVRRAFPRKCFSLWAEHSNRSASNVLGQEIAAGTADWHRLELAAPQAP